MPVNHMIRVIISSHTCQLSFVRHKMMWLPPTRTVLLLCSYSYCCEFDLDVDGWWAGGRNLSDYVSLAQNCN